MLCGSLSGSKALEPGHLLPGTGCSQDSRNQPVTDSIAWNQPNTVGKMRCYTEDAAVFMPSLSYYSGSSTAFSSCVNAKTNAIPFYHWYPVLAYLKKTMWIVYLFVTWTNESLKLSYILARAPHNDSQQLINHTGESSFPLLSLMIHAHCLYGFLNTMIYIPNSYPGGK